MSVNTLRVVAPVVQHDILIAEFIQLQFLNLQDHCFCKLFGIAAAESIPAVPAHRREAGLFREYVGIIEIIKSQSVIVNGRRSCHE